MASLSCYTYVEVCVVGKWHVQYSTVVRRRVHTNESEIRVLHTARFSSPSQEKLYTHISMVAHTHTTVGGLVLSG